MSIGSLLGGLAANILLPGSGILGLIGGGLGGDLLQKALFDDEEEDPTAEKLDKFNRGPEQQEGYDRNLYRSRYDGSGFDTPEERNAYDRLVMASAAQAQTVDPVYQGLAQGGIANVSGLAQIGMGFPGGPPMPGGGFGGGYAAMPSQMPRVPQELPSVQQPFPGMIQAPEQVPNLFQPEYKQRFGTLMNYNPLQQYGGYLEQQYGDPGFDQKKDRFLQEVLQKEQRTFGGGLLQPSNFQPGFMGGGPTAVSPTPTDFPAAFPMPGSNLFGRLAQFAGGGLIRGPGTVTSDSIPGQITQNGKPVENILVGNGEVILSGKDLANMDPDGDMKRAGMRLGGAANGTRGAEAAKMFAEVAQRG